MYRTFKSSFSFFSSGSNARITFIAPLPDWSWRSRFAFFGYKTTGKHDENLAWERFRPWSGSNLEKGDNYTPCTSQSVTGIIPVRFEKHYTFNVTLKIMANATAICNVPRSPFCPARPVGPSRPATPCAPFAPFSPFSPPEPGSPFGPVPPVSPRSPVKPWSPFCPLTPESPFSPFKPTNKCNKNGGYQHCLSFGIKRLWFS